MEKIFVDGHGMCEVWSLPKVAPKKQRRGKYVQDSFVHPAKMSVPLCRKIIGTYTESGETVLDPMAGINTTGVEAAYMGRNSIAVELEEKFVALTNQNIGLLEKAQTLTPKGKAVVIKGDSRELSKLLGEKVDVAVFSPPYTGRSEHRVGYDYQKRDEERGHKPYAGYREGYLESSENIGNLKYGKPVDAIVTSPPYADTPLQDYATSNKALLSFERKVRESFREKGYYEFNGKRYTEQEWRRINKGELKPRGMPELWKQIISQRKGSDYSEIARVDAIVTSPPFAQAQRGGGIAQKGYDGSKHGPTDLVGRRSYMPENVGEDKGNISRMPYGKVDAVISSPPYSESMSKKRKGYTTHPELSKTRHMGEGSSDENIGNLRHGKIDAVISSPPYSGSEVGKGIRQKRWEKIRDRKGFRGRKEWKNGTPCHYSDNPENIGNLKKETYLEAMFQIYRECLKTLKPGGKMVLVLKNFIRAKKVVRLDLDTKKLVEGCGFRWVETKLFRLPSMSFWRILYSRRYPEVDTSLLKFEFVEVFEKPMGIF